MSNWERFGDGFPVIRYEVLAARVAADTGDESERVKVTMCRVAIDALRHGRRPATAGCDGWVIWPEGVADRFGLWGFIDAAAAADRRTA